MRDGNPRNKQNWKLVCSGCGTEFPDDETVSLVDGHMVDAHPDIDGIHFNLVWVGKGPPPPKNWDRQGSGRRR